jgi:hypothetical protein
MEIRTKYNIGDEVWILVVAAPLVGELERYKASPRRVREVQVNIAQDRADVVCYKTEDSHWFMSEHELFDDEVSALAECGRLNSSIGS